MDELSASVRELQRPRVLVTRSILSTDVFEGLLKRKNLYRKCEKFQTKMIMGKCLKAWREYCTKIYVEKLMSDHRLMAETYTLESEVDNDELDCRDDLSYAVGLWRSYSKYSARKEAIKIKNMDLHYEQRLKWKVFRFLQLLLVEQRADRTHAAWHKRLLKMSRA